MKQSLWTGIMVISSLVGWSLWTFKQLQLKPIPLKKRIEPPKN